MKKINLLVTLFLLSTVTIFAQIPDGYYDSATGTGTTLKTQLYNIIKNHTAVSYTPGLWNAFYTTDDRDDGKVWDMYSSCNFTFGTDQDPGSGGTSECEYYNREHSFPRDWFGGAIAPMNTDLFHIYPTDKKVNNVRSNYPYGETNSPTYTSSNGSKLGPCSYSGYSETVFEPIDEYKGDLARSYFYMATCYEDKIDSWSSDVLNGTSYPCYTAWYLNMLLEWNQQDPISQKEIDRNNAVYNIQGNRNPYIDHPSWAECVWNNNCTSDINDLTYYKKPVINISPNPVKNILTIKSSSEINSVVIINTLGQIVFNKSEILNNDFKINLSQLKQGFYFISTNDINEQHSVLKIIKH